MADHPVVADGALGLQTEDLLQFASRRLASVIVLRLGCLPRKAAVVLRQIGLFQVLVGRRVTGDLLPSHFLDQSILMGAVIALHSPLACGELAAMIRMPSFSHIRPNCVTAASPRNCSPDVALRLYTFFQSV